MWRQIHQAANEHSDDSNHEVEAMKPGLQRVVLVPLLAELLANVGQSQTPRQRTGKRINHKPLEIHARHAGGKRYEGADGRQETADKDDDFAVVLQTSDRPDRDREAKPKRIGRIFRSADGRLTAHPVSDQRSEHAANRAGEPTSQRFI
jgi:hypothetical protein